MFKIKDFMKILALDIGDVHTGTAISDPAGIIAIPYRTLSSTTLIEDLKNIIAQEAVTILVLGLPQTLKGTESEQTKKTKEKGAVIQATFPDLKIVWIDERLTSKQAAGFKRDTSKEEKLKSHSRAAALILNIYLEQLRFQRELNNG